MVKRRPDGVGGPSHLHQNVHDAMPRTVGRLGAWYVYHLLNFGLSSVNVRDMQIGRYIMRTAAVSDHDLDPSLIDWLSCEVECLL